MDQSINEGKEFDSMFKRLLESTGKMCEILKPPSEGDLIKHLSGLSNMEVEGIYRWGSKQGRRLAKVECRKRGIIKESIFKRIKTILSNT